MRPLLLSDTTIRNVKPDDSRKRLTDGDGLYLLLWVKGGSHGWRLDYTHQGKRKTISLGTYPETGIKLAREKAAQARALLVTGADPSDQRKQTKAAHQQATENEQRQATGQAIAGSFQDVACQWWNHWSPTRSPRHAEYVKRRLEMDVFPAIGHLPIATVTAPHIVTMTKGIETRGALDIAKRAMQTCSQVFRYAIAHGVADRNPALEVKPSDVIKPRRKEHYARIEAKELPDLLRRIEAYQGHAVTRLALKLMALVFVRTGELIAARWDEFDFAAAEWRIPSERMKMRTPHIVPLSPQAIETLQALHTVTGEKPLLFPSERDKTKPMSNNTLLAALNRMGYAGRMTGHGFRGLASTILHEQGYPHHIIELQLAHQERNQVSAAYNFATYLKDRRAMMNAWADYLDKARRGANIITIPSRTA
jgi:integrase